MVGWIRPGLRVAVASLALLPTLITVGCVSGRDGACCASTSGGWQLARRTLVAASPGPASDVTPIAQPRDLRVNRSGAVVVTTRDGAILVGILPNLRTLSGR